MTTGSQLKLRPIGDADLDAVLELNNEWVPEVGAIDRSRLAMLVAAASDALVAVDATTDALAGFVIVLGPGLDYDSPNYRWFSQNLTDFAYVDRIVVATAAHRRGVGRVLYDAVFDHARQVGATAVACEVNVDPPNPVSLAFHSGLGFTELAQQTNYGGEVSVSLMSAPVGSTPALH